MTSLRLSPERLVRTGGIIPGRHPQGRRLTPCLAFRDEGAYRVTLMMDIHIGPSRVETLGISYIGPMFFFFFWENKLYMINLWSTEGCPYYEWRF